MSARVEVDQREFVEDGKYVVTFNVTDASEIQPELFTFDLLDRFTNVATLRDIANWPNSKAEAIGLNQQFYRANTLRLEYTTPREAREAGAYLSTRLECLLLAWNAEQPPSFGEIRTAVYP